MAEIVIKYNLISANGYTGVAWVFGKHDTPFTNRAIFGCVRYMNEEGLKRKFDRDLYVAQVEKVYKEYVSRNKSIILNNNQY